MKTKPITYRVKSALKQTNLESLTDESKTKGVTPELLEELDLDEDSELLPEVTLTPKDDDESVTEDPTEEPTKKREEYWVGNYTPKLGAENYRKLSPPKKG